MNRNVEYENLGTIRYKTAWDYQERLFNSLIKTKTSNGNIAENEKKKQFLLFCEHEHVYTLGKSGNKQNLLIARNVCESKKIDLHAIDRGGDITYHGPGQLVAYPIIDLEEFKIGIKKYISMLEDVVIETLKHFDIKGEKDEKAMGVWIDLGKPNMTRKICAIGVKASRFVTMHGLALNVNNDLSFFDYINPCGYIDKGVTSIQKELGKEVDFVEVTDKMKHAFGKVFGMTLIQDKP